MMNFHAVSITDDTLRPIANQLPVGKIFVTGKGLVPFVKRDLYDKLAVLIGTDAEMHDRAAEEGPNGGTSAKPAEQPLAEPPVDGSIADPWAAIRIGTTVLAVDGDEGWFEAIVVQIEGEGNDLTLRWRDYPGEPTVKTKRRTVGLACLDAARGGAKLRLAHFT